jgi:hypothetical protein
MEKLTNSLASAQITPSKELAQLHSLNAISEMFWACNGEELAESRKVLAGWSFSQRNRQRFVIPALTQPLTALRWDIADRPAFCIIKKIWLEDSSGEVHWTSELTSDLFTQTTADANVIAKTDNGDLQVLALGFDPSCILNIPETVLSGLQPGWALCTDWEAQLPAEGLPTIMEQFCIAKNQLARSKAELDAANTECERFKADSITLTAELDQLNTRFEQARENILRAEGQLALLKELVLGDGGAGGKDLL